jgi:hypothetical protein
MATPEVPAAKVSLATKPVAEEKSAIAKKLEAVTDKRIDSRAKLEKEQLSKKLDTAAKMAAIMATPAIPENH